MRKNRAHSTEGKSETKMRGLAASQLTEMALNKRQLKEYDESLRLTSRAYKDLGYIPAVSVHANTLIVANRPLDAISWLEQAYSELDADDAKLAKIEFATNLSALYRDYIENNSKAEHYLRLARQLAASVHDCKELRMVSSGTDVEEAILLFNKGDQKAAEHLALKRLKFFPECARAKIVLSKIKNTNTNPIGHYGAILAKDGSLLLEPVGYEIQIRAFRGMEEIYIPAAALATVFLIARVEGWGADYLFAKNENGDEAILAVSTPKRIAKNDAVALSNILVAFMRHADNDIREVVNFICQGETIIEEV